MARKINQILIGQQVDHANERELGLYGGSDNRTLYARQWNDDYQLDLIGREYCRDRQIGCDAKRVCNSYDLANKLNLN